MIRKRLFAIALAGIIAISSVQTFTMEVKAVNTKTVTTNQSSKQNTSKSLSQKDVMNVVAIPITRL